MPKWNMFDEAVAKERQTVRDHGLDKVMNRVREPDSWKGQALRQLAMRLELEDEVRNLKADNAKLVDQLEAMELRVDDLEQKELSKVEALVIEVKGQGGG